MADKKVDKGVDISEDQALEEAKNAADKNGDTQEWYADSLTSSAGDKSEAGEVALFELVRTSSVAHAAACRKLLWFDLHNTHLIVYTLFAIVLLVFSAYYAFFDFTPLVLTFSLIAAVFMIYVVARGHILFTAGMSFDEQRSDGVLKCTFYSEHICVENGGASVKVAYDAISSLHCSKNFILLQFKDIKPFENYVLVEKPVDSAMSDALLRHIKENANINRHKSYYKNNKTDEA